jgi:hypothetical protein
MAVSVGERDIKYNLSSCEINLILYSKGTEVYRYFIIFLYLILAFFGEYVIIILKSKNRWESNLHINPNPYWDNLFMYNFACIKLYILQQCRAVIFIAPPGD